MAAVGIRDDDMVITQISVAGLEDCVTAKMLLEYFEDKIGLVWRCRLKTSSIPPDSHPVYDLDIGSRPSNNNYEKAERHAFLHFAVPRSTKLALDAAGRSELILGRKALRVDLGPQNPHRMYERRRATAPYKLSDVSVDIGVMRNQEELLVGWRGPRSGVDFLVDPYNGACKLQFVKDTEFCMKDEARSVVIKCNFKVEFSSREILEIKQFRDISSLIVVLQLASSPLIYYRTVDDDIEDTVPFDLLDDDDPWIRTTDFTSSGVIGRCSTYRISLRPRNGPNLLKALEYLRQRRVPVCEENNFRGKNIRVMDEPSLGSLTTDPFCCIQRVVGISFEIMFLVNALMHKGIINYHQMSEEFFDLLRTHQEELIIAALTHMACYKHPVSDALKALRAAERWLLRNPKLLEKPKRKDENVYVRRLIITPTRAYCLPPEPELSNRVLRHYADVADRFLRVTFMDEAMQTLNKNVLTYYAHPILREKSSIPVPQRTTMFIRVKNILKDGFQLCGRKYSFLVFSANQLRDQSAWFFAENKEFTVAKIMSWMGKFTNRNVAKCAARMGQCFSSTYATVEVQPREVNSIPDIERNGYVFSDGIGMISPDLAMEVAKKLQLGTESPSAYQIRYAGYKGVVACWPGEKRLSLRPSMQKFLSKHTMLEICSWTRFLPGFMNRQIITLLTALGVVEDIFWKMQETMVSRLDQMLLDANIAFDVLTASCGDHGNIAAIMLSAGFRPQTEAHLRGMLTSIRAAQLGDLRERARIFVPKGRWLMGCLDEFGVLDHGQCFIQVSNSSLENCFAKHGSAFSDTKKNVEVIKGLVAVAKNPCLHPGDVRILEAVDVPGLHHLCDCLIFPQNGDRPHTNEASGSDLDGDVYFVTWDENLIPPSKRSWPPMEYTAPKVRDLPREVRHKDIIEFFSKNMVNENLGTICNAHVVHADLSEEGALNQKCVRLAELAALAVDFPKTGQIVNMPSELKPKMYPDFMGKEEFQTYQSSKILGKLYRRIKDVYDSESESPNQSSPEAVVWDRDLVIAGSESFLADAWSCKCSYNGQLLGLLSQYKVVREEEVVTGHIWSMPKNSSKKQGVLKDRLRHAYNALRKEFREVFEHVAPDFDQLSEDEKNIVYERKASAWYQVTYQESWLEKTKESLKLEDTAAPVLLSFAWIAADYLARIKVRRRRQDKAISTDPVDSLARYLAAKI